MDIGKKKIQEQPENNEEENSPNFFDFTQKKSKKILHNKNVFIFFLFPKYSSSAIKYFSGFQNKILLYVIFKRKSMKKK